MTTHTFLGEDTDPFREEPVEDAEIFHEEPEEELEPEPEPEPTTAGGEETNAVQVQLAYGILGSYTDTKTGITFQKRVPVSVPSDVADRLLSVRRRGSQIFDTV